MFQFLLPIWQNQIAAQQVVLAMKLQKIPVADISNLKVIFLAGDQISSTTTFDKGTNVDGIYTFHKVPGDVNAVAILGNTDKVITVHSSFSTLLDAIKKKIL